MTATWLGVIPIKPVLLGGLKMIDTTVRDQMITDIGPKMLVTVLVIGFTMYVTIFDIGTEGTRMALMGVFGATVQYWLGSSYGSNKKTDAMASEMESDDMLRVKK